jgi:hypothetical protein
VEFDEDVNGFNPGSEVSITVSTGSRSVSWSTVTANRKWRADISPSATDGTLTVSVSAGRCADDAGNTNTADSFSINWDYN